MIEFKKWSTPFEFGNIHIIDVIFGNGGFDMYLAEGPVSFSLPANDLRDYQALTIRLFNIMDRTVYRVEFIQVEAYRVLDEHGLQDLWTNEGRKALRSDEGFYPQSCRVKGHGWNEESIFSFLAGTDDGWSFLISSEWTCVEVLALNSPDIIKEGQLEPIRPS